MRPDRARGSERDPDHTALELTEFDAPSDHTTSRQRASAWQAQAQPGTLGHMRTMGRERHRQRRGERRYRAKRYVIHGASSNKIQHGHRPQFRLCFSLCFIWSLDGGTSARRPCAHSDAHRTLRPLIERRAGVTETMFDRAVTTL